MAKFDKVKDSGKRQEFNTGSVRDTAEGKGMPHLIAGEALAACIHRPDDIYLLEKIHKDLLSYNKLEDKNTESIHVIHTAVVNVIKYISELEDGTINSALTRLAQHYENGAKKYDKNNWRKGQPVSRYYDSAMRHIWKELNKQTDEDHAAAMLWNLLGIVQTKLDVASGILSEELDDFPFTIDSVFNEKEEK